MATSWGATATYTRLSVIYAVAIHADDLYSSLGSRRGQEVPAADVLVPENIVRDTEHLITAKWKYSAELIRTYLPDVNVLDRTRTYGQFYSDEEIERSYAAGLGPRVEALESSALELLDAEIDRLGGRSSTRMKILEWLDVPNTHTQLVLAPLAKFCPHAIGGL